MLITLDDLRRFTVACNFFNPTTLKRALHRMGFVQADPIRAPARVQDLMLKPDGIELDCIIFTASAVGGIVHF